MKLKLFLGTIACSLLPTMANFVPDTLIEAGALSIPCHRIHQDKSLHGEKGRSTVYKDSLNRTIAYRDTSDLGSNPSMMRSYSYKVYCGEKGSILFDSLTWKVHGPGYIDGGRSSLIGEEWTESGQVAKGILREAIDLRKSSPWDHARTERNDSRIRLSYTNGHSTDTIIVDSNVFVPDMEINGGDFMIPVKYHHTPHVTSQGGYKAYSTDFTDSLNRFVETYKFYHNLAEQIVFCDTLRSKVDGEFKIVEQVALRDSLYGVKELSAGDTTLSYDTTRTIRRVVASEWNDKGCITRGLLHRKKMVVNDDGSTPVSEDSVEVTIIRDSSGLYPRDTIYHDEVSVVFEDISYGQTIKKSDNKICLKGLMGGESVSLLNANGRLIERYTADRVGGLELNLNQFPAGVYFINSKNIRRKIICK